MSSKIDRELHGPSLTEVALAALLSMVIGVVLGAVYLSLKPVTAVKDVPKDAPSGEVFYSEGLHDSGKAAQAGEKLQTLATGGSVTLSEEELNTLVGEQGKGPPAAAPVKPGDKTPPAPPPVPSHAYQVGALNFHIHGGALQVAAPVLLSAFGQELKLIVQTRGTFEKQAGGVVFVPAESYVGSCPIQRIPWVGTEVLRRVLVPQPMPDPIAAAWAKVVDASIDGSTLRLTSQ